MATSYIQTLSPIQKQNLTAIVVEMKRVGITNLYTQAAILSVISKESNFIWQAEKSYRTTSNTRIREIFKVLAKLNDTQLNALKNNDVLFFNTVYGGKFGNATNEGYLYRGRGPNQLTFKGNYASIGKRIGVDLVKYPDLLITDANVAAKAVVDFFVREFTKAAQRNILKQYNTTGLNNFTNLSDSLKAVFQANRGWGKKGADTTGGYDKAKERVEEFHSVVDTIKENKGKIGGGLFFLILLILAIANKDKLSKAFSNIKNKTSKTEK